jgi:hypothetical protein
MRRQLLWVTATLVILLIVSAITVAGQASVATPIFDTDPQHIWNRLHRHFFVRITDTGEEMGGDTIDPLLWFETKRYFVEPTYQETVDLLDEFLNSHAEQQINDPLKRAVFQHDLWAIYDWVSSPAVNYLDQRIEIQKRLAQIMRRVALSKSEINALPDTYGLAIDAGTFPTSFDTHKPLTQFLPPDLLKAESNWVNVGNENGIAAVTHVQAFTGRSAFYVFYRLPAGRQATLDFIATLPTIRRNAPAPDLMHVALVRQLLLIDTDGNITPSPITESLQIRVLHAKNSQDVFQFDLRRTLLFAGKSGGLHAVERNEVELPQFMVHGFDPFESDFITLDQAQIATLNQCGTACHFDSGTDGIISYSRKPMPLANNELPVLTETTMASEVERIITWKTSQENWQTLKKLWLTSE